MFAREFNFTKKKKLQKERKRGENIPCSYLLQCQDDSIDRFPDFNNCTVFYEILEVLNGHGDTFAVYSLLPCLDKVSTSTEILIKIKTYNFFQVPSSLK